MTKNVEMVETLGVAVDELMTFVHEHEEVSENKHLVRGLVHLMNAYNEAKIIAIEELKMVLENLKNTEL